VVLWGRGFVYHGVNTMSDVPAAAFWVLAVACATSTKRRQAAMAGLATSAAVLIRPSLVPLGALIGLFLVFRPERSWPERGGAALLYALWSAPGCIAVALIQQRFYGCPFASGYGAVDTMFSASHVTPNLLHYTAWLWSSQTPVVALALLAPFLLP